MGKIYFIGTGQPVKMHRCFVITAVPVCGNQNQTGPVDLSLSLLPPGGHLRKGGVVKEIYPHISQQGGGISAGVLQLHQRQIHVPPGIFRQPDEIPDGGIGPFSRGWRAASSQENQSTAFCTLDQISWVLSVWRITRGIPMPSSVSEGIRSTPQRPPRVMSLSRSGPSKWQAWQKGRRVRLAKYSQQ